MADIFKYCADKKKKRIIIISDSTVAQYRNKTNVFLLQSRVSEDEDIQSIKWVFTEAGHGKSSCDAVGAALKTTMRNKISFDTDLIINSVQDIIDIVQPESTMKLFAHTREDINAMKSKVNGTLSPLKKALKIHYLDISPGGVMAKYMPSDANSFAVKIRITRRGMPNQVQEQEIVETEEERQRRLEEAEEWAWFEEGMSLDQHMYAGNMEQDQPDVEQQVEVEEQPEIAQQPEVEQQVEQQQAPIVEQSTSTRPTRSNGRGKKRGGPRGRGRSRPGA